MYRVPPCTTMLERPSPSAWVTRSSATVPTGARRRRFAPDARQQQPEAPIAGDDVLDQAAIAWLEDVQWQQDPGEEHDAKGEEGQAERHA
jgi:hypothetical protein